MSIGKIIEKNDNIYTVAIKKELSCTNCNKNCHKPFSHKMKIESDMNLTIGDFVEIIIPLNYEFLLLFLFFVISFVFIIIFYLITFLIFKNELIAVLNSAFGILLSFLILKLINLKLKSKIIKMRIIDDQSQKHINSCQ